jgi:hypothetical protein
MVDEIADDRLARWSGERVTLVCGCGASLNRVCEQYGGGGGGCGCCCASVNVLKIGGSGGWGSGLIGGGRGVAPLLGGCSSGGRYRVSVCIMVVDWFAKISCRVW